MRHFLLLGLVVASLVACQSIGSPANVTGSYGTLNYSGVVVRSESGNDYKYLVKSMTFTFDPTADVNRTEAIRNPVLRLRTTVRDPAEKRSKMTSEAVRTMVMTLDATHPTATIHGVEFVVNKALVDASSHTILDLTDGHIIWPMPTELKHSQPEKLKL